MAAANPYREPQLLRRNSMHGRPDLAELRVVLLGNNWRQRCLVIKLLVNKDVFDAIPEPQGCQVVKYHTLTVINTPDLLHSDLTEDRLTELVRQVAEASSPGPHVFLLVLEPESFTEQHQWRLRSILEKFSEKSFDHVIVLLLTDQQEDLFYQQVLEERSHLKRFIEECRYSYQWIRHCEDEELNTFARAELLTRLTRIVKNNHREYVIYEEFKHSVHPSHYDNLGTKPTESTKSQSLAPKVKKLGFTERPWKRSPEECYFQMLLLGDGDKKKSKHKMISGKSSHPEDIEDLKVWRGKKLKIVKSKDLFTMSVPEVLDEMKRCMREFNQGPNVLLLRPSEFTEKNIEALWFILSLCGPNALKHSILIFTDEQNKEPCENSLLRECKERYDKSTENIDHMMIKVEAMVEDNKGSFVSLTDVFTPKVKIEKNNFVFCGTHRSAKTRAISAILGPATCYAESSSECVKRQAEVSGRLVSIVELPALSGKPEREVLDECWSCVSMCDPEGVHAFVIVLPMGPLTDEDKAEFKTIQKTFGVRINSFTVILFTVESDPKAQAFTEFVKQHEDIQNLSRTCRGHVFININDPQRAPQVLEEIEKYSRNMTQGYTTKTFTKIQFTRLTQTTSQGSSLLECAKESEKTLRIVLIGKTGNGKSSSGNTILGRDIFESELGQKAITKVCQKEHSRVNSCRVEVVDTPGLFDKSMSNQEINDEMIKCISLLAPGPHVFLVVLGIGRFTPEENETLNLIKKVFGSDAQKYIIVLFTRGDELDKKKILIDDFIKDKCDHSCKKLISDCGNRYHVFNNDDESKRPQQVKELIQKIDALVEENGGGCYTNEMLKEAEAAIQEEVKRLMKEKEEEFMREKQEMEDKHKQEMQEIQQRMDKEREETERVRREKDNERREMEAKIIHERELRKKEQEIRDKEEQERIELDRVKQQDYERNIRELEHNLQRNFDLKSKNKIQQERKAWEEERDEWWHKRHNEDLKRQTDEQVKLERLEQEYKDKLETWRKEKEEDQQRREQEERERKELEAKHEQQMEDLIKLYEERARRKAEELNEFKERKEIDFADMLDKHLEQVQSLKHELDQKEREYRTLRNLAAHNETELKSDMVEIKTDMENLQSLHKHELIDLAIAALRKEKENCRKIKEIQKKHASAIEKCKKENTHEYERERKRKTESLKTKQSQEMKDRAKNMNKDTLPQEKRELSDKHKKQLGEFQSDLWNQYKQQLKEELDEKKKQHEEELSKITEEFLRKNEEYMAKQINDLEKKQKAEMDKLMKKAKGKVNEVELDQLETKHQIEMDKIKKKVFRDKGKCHIL